MKQIQSLKLTTIKGGGCYKYLRRMDRNYRRGNDDAALVNFIEYLDCMGQF